MRKSLKLIIAIILGAFLAGASLYYTAKFFFIFGFDEGAYWLGPQMTEMHCQDLKELSRGEKVSCGEFYVPPQNVVINQALKETFLTFP